MVQFCKGNAGKHLQSTSAHFTVIYSTTASLHQKYISYVMVNVADAYPRRSRRNISTTYITYHLPMVGMGVNQHCFTVTTYVLRL